jgi:hypothetical protein
VVLVLDGAEVIVGRRALGPAAPIEPAGRRCPSLHDLGPALSSLDLSAFTCPAFFVSLYSANRAPPRSLLQLKVNLGRTMSCGLKHDDRDAPTLLAASDGTLPRLVVDGRLHDRLPEQCRWRGVVRDNAVEGERGRAR